MTFSYSQSFMSSGHSCKQTALLMAALTKLLEFSSLGNHSHRWSVPVMDTVGEHLFIVVFDYFLDRSLRSLFPKGYSCTTQV